MESKDWSGFGYFSPDLEKIKQLVVCRKCLALEVVLQEFQGTHSDQL